MNLSAYIYKDKVTMSVAKLLYDQGCPLSPSSVWLYMTDVSLIWSIPRYKKKVFFC